MMNAMPIRDFLNNLSDHRLKAIETAASSGFPPSEETMREIASIQLVLTAVKEEIEAHQPKLGSGAERPLK